MSPAFGFEGFAVVGRGLLPLVQNHQHLPHVADRHQRLAVLVSQHSAATLERQTEPGLGFLQLAQIT